MPMTIAFDVYGTLIDTSGVVMALQKMMADKAEAFSQTWRSKQLEYTFRRGLMRRYADFAVCTADALDYSCLYHQTPLTLSQKQELLSVYGALPVFDDVVKGLTRLHDDGDRLFAFSNGGKKAVEELLINAGIRDFFQDVISVEAIQSFKPNPEVYQYFLQQAGAAAVDSWLVSANPFDVIGAVSAGMNAAWLQRQETAIFDPWDLQPTLTVSSLVELAAKHPN